MHCVGALHNARPERSQSVKDKVYISLRCLSNSAVCRECVLFQIHFMRSYVRGRFASNSIFKQAQSIFPWMELSFAWSGTFGLFVNKYEEIWKLKLWSSLTPTIFIGPMDLWVLVSLSHWDTLLKPNWWRCQFNNKIYCASRTRRIYISRKYFDDQFKTRLQEKRYHRNIQDT